MNNSEETVTSAQTVGESPLTTSDLARPERRDPPQADEPRSFSGNPAGPQRNGEMSPRPTALFPEEDTDSLRSRWRDVQAGFVDQPRKAVEEADSLVAGAMQRLAEMFAAERSSLESQWDRGDDVSTEELRLALTRYRSFFDRLLAI